MGRLILMRHGQSEWNKKNIFTGWVDIPLSEEGIQEALEGGERLADIPIDRIFTSTLIRGVMTAMLAMSRHHGNKVPVIVHSPQEKLGQWGQCYNKEIQKALVPVVCAWQLNERMYGELQGQDKQAMRKQYGAEQVHLWRRSYSTPPPQGESLQMTAERTLPFFNQEIISQLKKGENVFIAAHGNSLRSIIMELEGLSEEEVLQLEIPTGEPLFYVFKQGALVRDALSG